eukprot:CAMPEP_0115036296 /NCGR_PEP_ID=MMETSP0216-20121206/42032_1 /TAXON_ID=223996 /ORGANISM="Protocruzia adherens, Strain Boccale" /LENGTH=589 /DNA_ID=CAMNT_0002416085 /DNA_START=156 /DNA_END=1926 /DNA_ORIENTATION=-
MLKSNFIQSVSSNNENESHLDGARQGSGSSIKLRHTAEASYKAGSRDLNTLSSRFELNNVRNISQETLNRLQNGLIAARENQDAENNVDRDESQVLSATLSKSCNVSEVDSNREVRRPVAEVSGDKKNSNNNTMGSMKVNEKETPSGKTTTSVSSSGFKSVLFLTPPKVTALKNTLSSHISPGTPEVTNGDSMNMKPKFLTTPNTLKSLPSISPLFERENQLKTISEVESDAIYQDLAFNSQSLSSRFEEFFGPESEKKIQPEIRVSSDDSRIDLNQYLTQVQSSDEFSQTNRKLFTSQEDYNLEPTSLMKSFSQGATEVGGNQIWSNSAYIAQNFWNSEQSNMAEYDAMVSGQSAMFPLTSSTHENPNADRVLRSLDMDNLNNMRRTNVDIQYQPHLGHNGNLGLGDHGYGNMVIYSPKENMPLGHSNPGNQVNASSKGNSSSAKNIKKSFFNFPDGGWVCSLCQNYNFAGRVKCNRCKKVKTCEDFEGKPKHLMRRSKEEGKAANKSSSSTNISSSSSTSAGSGKDENSNPQNTNASKKLITERAGDWNCSNCKNLNFSFRTVCNRCQRTRGGGGVSMLGQQQPQQA